MRNTDRLRFRMIKKAQVAELVDALVSGACGFAIVQVRVLFWALPKIEKMQSYTEDEIVVQLGTRPDNVRPSPRS